MDRVVRLAQKELSDVKALAKREEISVAELIRRALREYIAKRRRRPRA